MTPGLLCCDEGRPPASLLRGEEESTAEVTPRASPRAAMDREALGDSVSHLPSLRVMRERLSDEQVYGVWEALRTLEQDLPAVEGEEAPPQPV